MSLFQRRLAPLALLLAPLCGACAPEPDVVVYVALDQMFSEELIQRFEQESGLVVRAHYDSELNKTVGLVSRIREEREAPRCDVFWNNEIAQTISLAEAGLLAPYDSPSAAGIPAQFRDPEHRWTGFAARARILIVNTDRVAEGQLPTSMWDLVDPAWAGQVTIARPLTGTTLTHIAALYPVLGEARAAEYVEAIKRGNDEGTINLARSNGQTMRNVREGGAAFGWTDTDDFNVALKAKYPVRAVYPDQEGPDALGTMVIPNTVAMIAGAPHPDNARRLIDFVLSEEVERALAFSDSAQIPLRSSVGRPAGMVDLSQLKVMQVDFVEVGRQLEARTAALTEIFLD